MGTYQTDPCIRSVDIIAWHGAASEEGPMEQNRSNGKSFLIWDWVRWHGGIGTQMSERTQEQTCNKPEMCFNETGSNILCIHL